MTTSKQSFEFEGPNALETAKTILSNYDISGELQRISVELEEEHKTEGGSEGNEKSVEEDRELKQIQADTNHHKVLTAVKELEDQGQSPVSGSEVFDHVEEVKEGSVYASLSKLWHRRLVEREKVKDGGNNHNVYEVSGYGEQELSRLGMYNG